MKRYWIKCEYAEKELSEGFTIGWERGCSIKLPEDDNIARVHARVKVSDDGQWRLTAVYPENPIVDDNDQKVQCITLGDKVSFRIGTTLFSCLEMEQPTVIEQRPVSRDEPGPIRPPKGVRTLQYFFRDKLYRIAVLGGKASGKTCMYTALSMARQPRSDEATCTRILHLPKPDPAPWERTPEDDEAAQAFQLGKRLLDGSTTEDGKQILGSIDYILQGKVPPPTHGQLDDARAVFKLTSKARKPAILETVDYGGELAAPDVGREPKPMRLKKIMEESHGLIVLVQVMRDGRDYNEEAKEVLRLTQTFNDLAKLQHQKKPVVLVMNKWDRIEGYDPDVPYSEHLDALNRFVESEGADYMRALVHAIRDTVGEDNFKMLPMSALGSCEIVNVEERPRQNLPLKSFGLEDPFFWLIDRADAAAVREYENDTGNLSMLPWISLWSKQSRMLRARRSRMLAGDISDKSLIPRIKRAGRRYVFKRFAAKIQVTVFAIAAILAAEYIYSSRQFHVTYRTMKSGSPITSSNAYETSRAQSTQLLSYVESSQFRHLLLSLRVTRNEARNLVYAARSKQVNYLIGTMGDENRDWTIRVDALDRMRNDHPHDASSLKEQLDAIDKQYANELWSNLTNGDSRIQVRLYAGKAFVERYPDDGRRQDAARLNSNLGDAQKIAKEVESALNKKPPDWETFATLLTGTRFRQFDEDLRRQIINDVGETFDGRLLSFVNDAVANVYNTGLRDDISRTLNNADLQLLQRTRESISSRGEAQGILNSFDHGIRLFQLAILDRRLYRAAGHNSIEDCNRYIAATASGDIPGFMRKEVEQFIKGAFSGRFVIENVRWNRGSLNHERPVTMRIKDATGNPLLHLPEFANFNGGASTTVNGDFERTGLMMNAPIQLAIEMTLHTRMRRDPLFTAMQRSYPSDWFKGITIRANETRDTGHGRSADVHIKLIHYHRLPDWTSRRFLSLDSTEW